MLKKFMFLMAIAAFIASCSNPPADTTKETGESQSFGDQITSAEALTHSQLIAKLSESDSVVTKFTGKVESVCQVKGCWMNITDGNAQNDIFVKFKDYGFFMPKDISGRQVIMEGVAYREMTSVDELRHYAEDEGLPQEEIDAITEPKEELKFMAHGVLLLPEDNKQ